MACRGCMIGYGTKTRFKERIPCNGSNFVRSLILKRISKRFGKSVKTSRGTMSLKCGCSENGLVFQGSCTELTSNDVFMSSRRKNLGCIKGCIWTVTATLVVTVIYLCLSLSYLTVMIVLFLLTSPSWV